MGADYPGRNTGQLAWADGEIAQSPADTQPVQARARLELVAAFGYSQEVVDTLVQSSAYSQLEGAKNAGETFAYFGLAWGVSDAVVQ